MNRPFGRLLLAPLTLSLVAALAMAPMGAGARGGGGGGGARAGGGAAGARPPAQVNNSRADARTNDVRSTSVNNVNVNRDVNVNVDVDQRPGWDHPVAGAIVVGGAMAATAAVVGSYVNTVPTGCVPVNYGGMLYQQCADTWYQPQGSHYIVVNPPY